MLVLRRREERRGGGKREERREKREERREKREERREKREQSPHLVMFGLKQGVIEVTRERLQEEETPNQNKQKGN